MMIWPVVKYFLFNIASKHFFYKLAKNYATYYFVHNVKNKGLKTLYTLYSIMNLEQKAANNLDRGILQISECFSTCYFITSKQSLLKKIVYYYIIKAILNTIISTISKKSLQYLLENFSIKSLILTIAYNELNIQFPIQIDISDSDNPLVRSDQVQIQSLASLPTVKTGMNSHIYDIIIFFITKRILTHFLLRYINIFTKSQFIQQLIVTYLMIYGKQLITLIQTALISALDLLIELKLEKIPLTLLKSINIDLITLLIVLGKTSFDVVIAEYPAMNYLLDAWHRPSEIDWHYFLTHSCNLANNTMMLTKISFDVVITEYPPIQNFIDFLNETPEIDWEHLLSFFYNTTNNTVVLSKESFDIAKEVTMTKLANVLPEDLTKIGEILNAKMSQGAFLVFIETLLAQHLDPVLQQSSAIAFRHYHNMIQDNDNVITFDYVKYQEEC